MRNKLIENIKVINSTALPPWYKLEMAEWLIAAVPMYYLANGRVHASEINKWRKITKKTIHSWIVARSLCTKAIHVPKNLHGLGIKNMHDIDVEHKLAVFCQFLFSNDSKLRKSTITNLQVKWHKQKLIVNEDNVLTSYRVNATKGTHRCFRLWDTVCEHLKECNIQVHIVYLHIKCFCAMPRKYAAETFHCIICKIRFHTKCDRVGASTGTCAKCRIMITPTQSMSKKAPYITTYFQDNCYNWALQAMPVANPA